TATCKPVDCCSAAAVARAVRPGGLASAALGRRDRGATVRAGPPGVRSGSVSQCRGPLPATGRQLSPERTAAGISVPARTVRGAPGGPPQPGGNPATTECPRQYPCRRAAAAPVPAADRGNLSPAGPEPGDAGAPVPPAPVRPRTRAAGARPRP